MENEKRGRGRPKKNPDPDAGTAPVRKPRPPRAIHRVVTQATLATGTITAVEVWEATIGGVSAQFGQLAEAEAWARAERGRQQPTELMRLCRSWTAQLGPLVEALELEPDSRLSGAVPLAEIQGLLITLIELSTRLPAQPQAVQ